MTMKLLLAVDGSKTAARAVQAAIRLARAMREPPSLVLLHADLPLMRQVVAELGPEAAREYHESNGRLATRSARAALKRAGVAFTEKLLVGDPAATIIKTAQSGKFDLILLGSQGRGALKTLLLGSVAAKVLSQSTIAVMVVR